MKLFILNKEPEQNIVRLEGKDFHYLVRVRRLAVGECFPALLPAGTEILVQVLSIDNGVLTGKKVPGTFLETPPDIPPIILFQALPGGDKMDLIVRQAAEGGITEIVPFVSEHSPVKIKTGNGQKFLRRERIIKEARQQSGSKTNTVIHQPLFMNELLEYWKKLTFTSTSSVGLLFHHRGLEKMSLHGYLNNKPDVVVLAVGPEGGFSDSEVTLFLENSFKPITIGDTVLRTETAALYCAAAVRIILLERNSWEMK